MSRLGRDQTPTSLRIGEVRSDENQKGSSTTNATRVIVSTRITNRRKIASPGSEILGRFRCKDRDQLVTGVKIN